MSKKTDNVNKAIEKLTQLKNQLKEYNQTVQVRELQDIEFEMDEQLKNLKFWFDSLYSYNGRSTSNAKKTSSRENGKKGGRPPKRITQAKLALAQIEIRISDIDHNLKMNDNIEEIEQLQEEKEALLKNQKEFQQILSDENKRKS